MPKVQNIKKCHNPQISSLTNESYQQLDFLPEKLRTKLFPFQKDGITFALGRQGRCMVADEMGLGKTIQAIAIAYFYKEEWPLLIVVPSSLRCSWTEEIEKWIPELEPEEINVIQNKTDVGRISTSKVTVLGYGLLTTDALTLIDALNNQNFKVVIVDESHYMKSRTATRTKILLPVVQKSRRAILLTGTPALGRPEELFMQIEALFPQKFGTWTDYAKRYCNARIRYFGKRPQWDYRGASNLKELHHLLNDIMIRRLKTEVLTQLPPKIRQHIPFDLPDKAAKDLNTSLEEWKRLMRSPNPGGTETVLGLITRIFKQTAIAKAGAVKDYIKMILQNDSLKFLVFAHHLSMLQACTEAVIENKTRYIRIDGSVPSSERIHLVNQFQNDPDTRVAILSIQAAGQGLTFTAASHVVFAELYWDPGHIKQAEDRAHRIGQCSSVTIHYLIANGTLDTLMWGMLNRKVRVTGSTLNGRQEQLQAEEDDKEKWDFLHFAEAWTPNDNFEELRKEVLFTHFEKEKQHDIQSFFLPKPKKRQLETSCDESRIFQEKNTIVASRDIIDSEHNFEPETKRLKSVTTHDCNSLPEEKPSRPGQTKDNFMEHVHKAKSLTTIPTPPGKDWQCGFCTYINNSLLSYCEMCENPQGSADSLNHIQDKNKNEEDDSQIDISKKVQASLDCDKQVIAQSEPNQLANSKEEMSEVRREDRLTAQSDNEQLKSSDILPVYDTLMFCASKNTDRIHLYTKDGKQMNCNFIPLDIKLDLWEDLPTSFQLKQNRSLILRFVREWSSLTSMKQRIIRKSGQLFCSPILALEEITKQQNKLNSTKRYITKEDVAIASMDKMKNDGGHVRLITKKSGPCVYSTKNLLEDGSCVPLPNPSTAPADLSIAKGYLQAVDNEGNPLCLHCQHPTFQTKQECKANAWDSRFCSLKCQEEFWIRSDNSYMRAKVFEIEHGVCQLCNVNAQELFLCLRDAPLSHRKNLLDATWTSKLPLEQLNEMIRNPKEGHFWQVDHIKPVYKGGGQCTLNNLQTLCTVCHKEKTAKQAKERSQMRRQSLASKHGSDITRFLVKK
ncbi:zinc finger RANBP2-type containing 3, transcript variant X2 [Ictidomys tridecemlineatus]|uniref:DNA annealing helicase and endonuclease ZRANB3 isoform X1 n=3 Tax=Ictidomys tridecemlineatus TaxID=43179 RepID=UPI00038BB3B0|nr:DNA annealing helicase and endonuclease ZRANB3 isoform X1 [Ictidomys tridecemlineatus]XP_021577009.1 DNA annealing helicase and endonuclease ZRANB3 isoform X1 [Ictidomys tridecemlineatus]XP_040150181.1 DNA annealing helicase and endonuclease ZRANB3 isoform X1 [Ictidomys tridecemlineatus]KAG3274388.1 zinc finger RANBP2-type containing 3, transcript variant X1 [Ictidomys tridecemlineatus]KAG3274389.1 zinc finger RANBP2-type containing 3, transcript variant X2 [Ictidomys tridecemlineatus]